MLPLFVAQILRGTPCITGLFVAGVLSGALSTVSSGLSSLSAVAFQDFILAGFHVKVAENKKALAAKCISAANGVLCYVMIYLIRYLPGVMKVFVSILYIA